MFAVILTTLGLVVARFPMAAFGASFAAVFTGMVIATAIALAATIIRGTRARRELLMFDESLVLGGGPPRWALPIISLSLVASSAAVAFVAG